MTGNIKWLLAAAFAAILFPAAAQAQYPYGGMGYGGWGQPNYGQGIYQGSNYRPPYFALHPPVYYSHEIIRRPMGASPFAYPSWYTPPSRGGWATMHQQASRPLMVANPFVKPAAAAENTSAKLQTSVEVTNPYVAGE